MPSSADDRALPSDAVLEDLEDLYETAPCAYLSLDASGRIAKANRTFGTWVERPMQDIVGMLLHDLLSFGSRIFYETHVIPRLKIEGTADEFLLELLTASGTKMPVFAGAAEKRDASGKHIFTRFTIFGAAERQRYERRLVDARDAAENTVREERETSELREQFIAVLGHDLRNPLASIASGIHLLSDREKFTDRGRRVVTLMQGSVLRASTLIDNVLDFARGRLGGGLTLSKDAKTPLAPYLMQVVDEIRSIAPDRQIIAEIEIEQPIMYDLSRIGQLASNLLGNAVTHGAQDMPITVRASVAEGWLELSIANGGLPIPEAERERLFQPFFRGEVRPHGKGLGLGLHIASEIARAHDGTLTVVSSDNETRFTFRMPIE